MPIYLGAGSNLGDRRAHLARALAAMASRDVRILRVSPVVESPAMLLDDAPPEWNRPFLNLVAECDTRLAPNELLQALKAIEAELGRDASARWAPRPIDLDILLWDAEEIALEHLRVPHPGLHERAFVLAPLAFLRPLLAVPGQRGRTVLELTRALREHIPLWMGIVNLTPFSFSDGGEIADGASFAARIDALVAAGAHMIDLGAESTRPGATALTADEEWRRLEPRLGALRSQLGDDWLRPRVSTDTYLPENARRALDAGAAIVNDVSGLTSTAMLELAAAGQGTDWVAMHNLGVPADRTVTLPTDRDPVASVAQWLEERLREWERAGLDLERIVFDPGVGFGKNPLQSLRLMRHVREFQRYGLRCLVGHSRKSFMGPFAGTSNAERDLVTVGGSLALAAQGVEILRVHNIAAHAAAQLGFAHSSF
jgi:2-amino-4-hydroxy-6-hydroxymethyldihydropteridine diphosphokinase/dihydropteroate synthase